MDIALSLVAFVAVCVGGLFYSDYKYRKAHPNYDAECARVDEELKAKGQ